MLESVKSRAIEHARIHRLNVFVVRHVAVHDGYMVKLKEDITDRHIPVLHVSPNGVVTKVEKSS